jgi:hypothetical protein
MFWKFCGSADCGPPGNVTALADWFHTVGPHDTYSSSVASKSCLRPLDLIANA